MKKLIAALTALTALTCMFTGCGNDESSSEKAASTKASSSAEAGNDSENGGGATDDPSEESSEADTAKAETTEAETSEKPSASGNGEVSSDMEEALNEMINCINNADVIGMYNYMFPSKIVDLIFEISADEGMSREDVIDRFKKELESNPEKLPMTITGIKMSTKLDDDEMKEIQDGFTEMFENMDEEAEAHLDFDLKDYMKIKDVCSVDVTITTADGEEETENFIAYYLESEGWKFDQSMISYVKKSKKSSANSSATTLNKAATSALADLDAKGVDVMGSYIISSDSSQNVNVPAGFDVSDFDKRLKAYFSDADKLTYFIVCQDGWCSYSAAYVTGNERYVGTYPTNYVFGKEGPEPDSNEYSYEELYDMAKSNLK